MSRISALSTHKLVWSAALALLSFAARPVSAQVAFDGVDWTLDRGSITVDAAKNALPFRQGSNQITTAGTINALLDAYRDVTRWVWPRTRDITLPAPSAGYLTVDNPDVLDATNLAVTKASLSNGLQPDDALAFWLPDPANLNFTLTPYADHAQDFTGGGYSYPAVDANYPLAGRDYGYVIAKHNDFVVTHDDGSTSPALPQELAALPNVSPNIYSVVHNVLLNPTLSNPVAVWTIGTQGTGTINGGATPYFVPPNPLPANPAFYNIDIFSPGDGTLFGVSPNQVAYPNVTRAFVRVSWKNTVVGGAPNFPGINDPVNSRIFVVDLHTAGWSRLQGATQSSAAVFPNLGGPNDQLTVTLYAVTPDDTTPSASDGSYINQQGFTQPPLVVADAVRFTPHNVNGASLGATSGNGSIISPAVATNKLANSNGNTVWFIARNEDVAPTALTSYNNPVIGDTATIDPTGVASVPVFYALKNFDGNAGHDGTLNPLNDPNLDVNISNDRVIWRVQGDSDSGGTASASPLLANVRTRQVVAGAPVTKTILYFVTRATDGKLGHIYAFDPAGNATALQEAGPVPAAAQTTTTYWTYPSVRPLTVLEQTAANLPTVYHDPNYRNSNTIGYPSPTTWAADQVLIVGGGDTEYYDGDIVAVDPLKPIAPGNARVRSDTRVTFGGGYSPPIVIDDAGNTGGAQLLIVPALDGGSNPVNPGSNGRVYAFDAGGRGDYDNATFLPGSVTQRVPGTTQRIWTWPHFAADTARIYLAQTGADPVRKDIDGFENGSYTATPLTIKDELAKGSFRSAPSYDPNYPVAGDVTRDPILLSSADGHVYGVLPVRDVLKGVSSNVPNYQERMFFSYPQLSSQSPPLAYQTLGATPSTPVIYKPANSVNNQKYAYFTCGGRVYSIPLPNPNPYPGVTSLPIQLANTNVNWVYPPTPNPPFQDPTNATTLANTAPLTTGFSDAGTDDPGNAPVVLDSAVAGLTPTDANNPVPPNGVVYAVGVDGIVYALDAAQSATQLYTDTHNTNGFVLGTVHSSPIVVPILPDTGLYQPAVALPVNTSVPSLVFTDDAGQMYAYRTIREADGAGTGGTLLPVIHAYFDSQYPRSASSALAGQPITTTATIASGYVVEGDEYGQLRAYSYGVDNLGNGPYGSGGTVGQGEPRLNNRGANYVSIDTRVADLYTEPDLAKFTQNPPDGLQTLTPLKNEAGAAIAGTATPAANTNGVNGIVYDWGEFLTIAAAGVYHALPTDGTPNLRGTFAPVIRVTFRVRGPDSTVPPRTETMIANVLYANGKNPNNWPVDLVALNSGYDFSIFGIDPEDTMNPTTPQKLTGSGRNVFPWVAVYRFRINPGRNALYTPGSEGYSATVVANVEQTVEDGNAGSAAAITASRFQANQQSSQIEVGQNYWQGESAGAFGSSPNNLGGTGGTSGTARNPYIANPLALTVGYYDPNKIYDETGGRPNIIGWAGADKTNLANIREILGNGNYVGIGETGIQKALFAPLDLTQDGDSRTYTGVDATGARIPLIYVMDRSAVSSAGRQLLTSAVARPLQWWGGYTSVMNPLPWDQLPDNGRTTIDYPSIPASGLSIHTGGGSSGVDITHGYAALTPPTYKVANDPTSRLPIPTPLTLSLQVPVHQPANVNRGPVTYGGITFGSPYVDIAGNSRADNTPFKIVGPLSSISGDVATNSPRYPAGGYIANIDITASIPGVPQNKQTSRQFSLGVGVPPNFKMRVEESTLDIGKVSHSFGYSPLDGAGSYVNPFAPTGLGPYQSTNSPWNDENQIGDFFRPFTLINESNVNLVDLRIAKLSGVHNSNVAATTIITPDSLSANPDLTKIVAATRLSSDTVNSLLSPPLPGIPFGVQNTKLGNIGIVSSFDHGNLFAASGPAGVISERNLYPINNVTVQGTYVQQAANLATAGLMQSAWPNGLQDTPSIHKPRAGASQGTIATIPDVPPDYSAGSNGAFTPAAPKISIGIPLGTPVGTYSGKIFPYEDTLPVQWREWLNTSLGLPFGNGYGEHDDIFNTNIAGVPIEPFADPTFTLRVNVTEAKLTGFTPQSKIYGQIDAANGIGNVGLNVLPAALMLNTNNPTTAGGIGLYFASNRQPNGSPYLLGSGTPKTDAPWSLAYSFLSTPYSALGNAIRTDANFGVPAKNQWWQDPTFYPGYDAALQPLNFGALFPSLPGNAVANTVRYASPSVAPASHVDANGNVLVTDSEAWLFFQGSVDKTTASVTGLGAQVSESRTFYTKLENGVPVGAPLSFQNDAAQPKYAPKPLLVKWDSGQQRFLYNFWYTGDQSRTSIYYNANVSKTTDTTIDPAGWNASATQTGDLKLPTPPALTWMSDPVPVYRSVYDPSSDSIIDAIDVSYTGMLKNRSTVEVLLSRYRIVRVTETDPVTGAIRKPGQLVLVPLPTVYQETLSRVGTTNVYEARDAGWVLPSDPKADPSQLVQVFIQKNGATAQINGFVPNRTQRARFDNASGLAYFDSLSSDGAGNPVVNGATPLFGGGQIVVDSRSGTVSFPNVPPGRNDIVTISYTPYVMRLNASRDESNLDRFQTVNPIKNTAPALYPRNLTNAAGKNTAPVLVFDRAPNPRVQFVSPQVVFANKSAVAPTIDRMWVLYNKTDTSGAVKSAIYLKSMRLAARLPYPVALTPVNNGVQSFINLTVSPTAGPYEVDWARGRIYFTEKDEGRVVTINYTYYDPATNQTGKSGDLIYRIAWNDEISATGQPAPGQPLDQTTPEVLLPTDSAVNEGQVMAFKDPFVDKLWVFWASTRSGTTDLFYETISPQLYPRVSNQR